MWSTISSIVRSRRVDHDRVVGLARAGCPPVPGRARRAGRGRPPPPRSRGRATSLDRRAGPHLRVGGQVHLELGVGEHDACRCRGPRSRRRRGSRPTPAGGARSSARTPGLAATMLTARVTSGPRISMVASTPSTVDRAVDAPSISRSAASLAPRRPRRGSMPAAQGRERHRAVHGAGVEVVEARAGRPAPGPTVDLPEPAGPSMAMTLIGADPTPLRARRSCRARRSSRGRSWPRSRDPRSRCPGAAARAGRSHRHAVVVVGLDGAPGRTGRAGRRIRRPPPRRRRRSRRSSATTAAMRSVSLPRMNPMPVTLPSSDRERWPPPPTSARCRTCRPEVDRAAGGPGRSADRQSAASPHVARPSDRARRRSRDRPATSRRQPLDDHPAPGRPRRRRRSSRPPPASGSTA